MNLGVRARLAVSGLFLGAFVLPGAMHAEVIQFGCPAYLIGGTPNLPELQKKGVTSMVIDPSSGVTAAQARSYGIIPIYYVNAFCQPDKYTCNGPKLSASNVSIAFGETIPQPDTEFFYNNFSAQVQQVQKLGGTIIDLDNMDEYVRRKHVQAIRYLIESAGKAGINVVMKNEDNQSLINLSNVVGAVIEPGSEDKKYRAAFTAAGKPTAGILMINGSGGDAYTSVSKVNYSGTGKTEYTEFYGCGGNTGTARAPAPPTNYQITPPSTQVSQETRQPSFFSKILSEPLKMLQAQTQGPTSQLPPMRSQPSPMQLGQYFGQNSVTPVPMQGLPAQPTSQSPQPEDSMRSLLRMIEPQSNTQNIPIPRPVSFTREIMQEQGTLQAEEPTVIQERSSVTVTPIETATTFPSPSRPPSMGTTSPDMGESLTVSILTAIRDVLRNVLEFFSR